METPTTPRYPFFRPQAVPFVMPDGVHTPRQTKGYTPDMIKNAYGFGASSGGKGITVAVIEAYGYDRVQNDLDVFSGRFGLPQINVSISYPDGKPAAGTYDWEVETALDIQWVHALAPKADILAVFAKDESMESLLSAVKAAAASGAHIISMSFGSPEYVTQGEFGEFLSSSRKLYTSSAGDTGGSVYYPSSSAYVLSVGGTDLAINSAGRRTGSETAWRFGGGGPSRYERIPAWQSVFADIAALSGAYRATPDAAFFAAKTPGLAVYLSEPSDERAGGWTCTGGTSIGAACYAALCARLLESRPASFEGESAARYFYALAGGTKYDEPQFYFNDITLGSNGKYSAKVGWDFCTGLGSPVARQIIEG